MQIIECKTQKQISATYEVIKEHYNFSKEEYLSYADEMMDGDYRMIGIFDDAEKCLSVLGFRVGRRFYCGKYLHMDNLIVCKEHRRQNLAEKMIDWAYDEAAKLGCDTILADTYVENYPAHKLFFKRGMHIRGYHMRKIL